MLRAIAKYDEAVDKQTRLALHLLAQTFDYLNAITAGGSVIGGDFLKAA